MSKGKILHVGCYPPPIGGISVHIERLHAALISNGWESEVVDYTYKKNENKPDAIHVLSSNPVLGVCELCYHILRQPAGTIIHYHISIMRRFQWILPLLFLVSRGRRQIVTLHSGRVFDRRRGWSSRLVGRVLLKMMDYVITVNDEQKYYLDRTGMVSDHVKVIPAFIQAERGTSGWRLPFEISTETRTVVLTSGQCKGLYNYRVLYECIEHLPQDDFVFVFAMYGASEPSYREQVLNSIRGYSNAVVVWDLDPSKFTILLSQTDVYVRTTTSDGDSLAVREALAAGKRVLATDCVARPFGCELFDASNSDKLQNLLVDGGETETWRRRPQKDAKTVLFGMYSLLLQDSR